MPSISNSNLFRGLAVAFWCLAVGAPAVEPPPASESTVRNLSDLCRVWGMARYLHPALAQTNIDWDMALVAALPKVRAAHDEAAFVDAVQSMLGALQDPVTRVVRKRPPATPPTIGKNRPVLGWLEDDCLVVHLNPATSEEDFFNTNGSQLREGLSRARSVVFDARGAPWAGSALAKLSDRMPLSRYVPAPSQRYIAHSGYKPQSGQSSGGYSSKLETESVQTLVDVKAPRFVFLADADSTLPLIVLALQQAGNGWIVAQGPISNSALVFRQSVSIGSNYEARIRTSELILEKKAFGLSLGEELLTLTPDAEVQADVDRGDAGPAMKAALGLIRGTQQSSRATLKKAAVAAPKPVFAPDNPYREMHDPDLEHRLLALFRFWNIIHFFYPYQHLMDEPWDNVLPRFIPRFESAAGAREYQLAIAELATFVPDGHTSVGGTEIAKLFGVPAPVFLSRVEGRPIVTGFLDESVAKTAGLKKGDEILTVDGRPLEQALEALAKYVTASTPEQIDYKKLSVVLGGPPDSNARLSVRGADGETREIELPRRVDILKAYYGAAHTDEQVFHVLPGNIGYAVLEWLKPEKVDAMFEAFEGTKAIIFDLRGYPQWTAWSIAPRLSARSGPAAAVFRRNLVTGKNPTDVYQFTQPLPTTTKSKYTGKVVTLINQRAISRSEYTGLFFEVACNTTFIGSRTAGANGDVTDFILPGNIRVGFTGHDVRHADGRQLQRVGLIPQIEVKPTIAGVRAGRDEVLERAIQFIEKGN